MDDIPVGAVSLREVSYVCICSRRNTLAGKQTNEKLHFARERSLKCIRRELTVEPRNEQLLIPPPDLRVFPDGGSFRYLILYALSQRAGRRRGDVYARPGKRFTALPRRGSCLVSGASRLVVFSEMRL
jgi:hypothetical protein